MTSESFSRQWGHRGVSLAASGRGAEAGSAFRGGRGVLLLLESPEHAKGVLVDRAARAPAADRIPGLPVDFDTRRPHLELFLQAGALLRRAHAELPVAMQRLGLAVGRTKELDRLAPGALQRRLVDSRAQPAAAVEEVVALLHQHLAQAVLQDLYRATDAGLDHHGERRVEDRVGGHELAPFAPGLVEVGEVAEGARLRLPLRTARIGAQRLEAAVQNPAVAEVVEAHRGGGDVGLERWRARGPFGVAQAEQLLVVGDAQDEVGEAQATPPHSWGVTRWSRGMGRWRGLTLLPVARARSRAPCARSPSR